ncbi:hypothetical protein BVRB_7g178870 [Beta vulgaris subsp. vulgaris]|uniref:Uncharacterized protein n=1 Tax=Beta vulgaris subsp. vulgaris TaxID=3555 RepID=A0A0J8E1X4_BETVV|nr:hypothetical protein BVRB_7g178870 [Beta vulgaris subsp. vulgaris]
MLIEASSKLKSSFNSCFFFASLCQQKIRRFRITIRNFFFYLDPWVSHLYSFN